MTQLDSATTVKESIGQVDRITLVGLVFETAAGLHRKLDPGLGCQLGVGGQSFEILLRLARTPGHSLRMSDLAAQTGLTPSGVTRAVDRLFNTGLVSRDECPNDRRSLFATLTSLGTEKISEAITAHTNDVDQLLGGLLDQEQEKMLVALLQIVRDRVHPEATLGATGSDRR